MIIRRMTSEDVNPLYALLSNPRVMQYLEPPFGKKQAEQFLQRAGLSDPPLIYAVEEDGSFIGSVIYHDYEGDGVEIGWVLYPEYWGKGYASRLTERMIEKARSSGKDLVIECCPEQQATRHIAKKYGFVYAGSRQKLDVFKLTR